jgi:hypothetical protein
MPEVHQVCDRGRLTGLFSRGTKALRLAPVGLPISCAAISESSVWCRGRRVVDNFKVEPGLDQVPADRRQCAWRLSSAVPEEPWKTQVPKDPEIGTLFRSPNQSCADISDIRLPMTTILR